jgi:hypothetical protein
MKDQKQIPQPLAKQIDVNPVLAKNTIPSDRK